MCTQNPAVVGGTIKRRFVLEDIFQEGKRTHFRFKVRLLNQREETLLEGYHVYRLVTGEKRSKRSNEIGHRRKRGA
jgi:hypothetical protein